MGIITGVVISGFIGFTIGLFVSSLCGAAKEEETIVAARRVCKKCFIKHFKEGLGV
ncbi:MAG: hypothetical protein IT451_11765 [Candidatus Brocadia sp.]|nr:hypothetical protein [Candidatus Brocadia sp.]